MSVCLLLATASIMGCPSAEAPLSVVVPHGYMARLQQVRDGRLIQFGPFVGYYFRPQDPDDPSRLRFVCFNEKKFYSSDRAEGAKLYEGVAVRATLPESDVAAEKEEAP